MAKIHSEKGSCGHGSRLSEQRGHCHTKGGAHGVSSLDTPALKETCLVMFGKGFGVDIEFVQKRIIIIDFIDFSAHFRVRSPSSCHSAPLHRHHCL